MMTISTLISNLREDAELLISAQAGRMQLKAVEKGVPAAVKSIYMSVILIFVLFFISTLLMTGGFAFGLLFASAGEVHEIISSLTLGFCCLDVLMLLIIGLLFVLKAPVTGSFEAKITNNILDSMERKQRQAVEDERVQTINADAERSEDETIDADDTEVLRVSRVEHKSNTPTRP